MQRIIIKSYETEKNMVTPIVFLVVGLILFNNPGGIVKFISYILGGIFLLLGVSKLLKDSKRVNTTTADNFYSILMIVMGTVFMFCSGTIEFVIRLVMGLWIAINGANSIINNINLIANDKRAYIPVIVGLLLLIIGIYTVAVSNLVFSTIGLILIIYSVLDIINHIYYVIKNK